MSPLAILAQTTERKGVRDPYLLEVVDLAEVEFQTWERYVPELLVAETAPGSLLAVAGLSEDVAAEEVEITLDQGEADHALV